MAKCDICNKIVTKKTPGLECNKCEKLVHFNPQCSGLTNKQITALRAAENLEWTCQECCNSSTKRRSIVVPDDEEEEENEALQNSSIDVKQLLKDISKEVERAIKKELREVNTAIQYCSDKIDEFTECMESFKTRVKELEKTTTTMKNTNAHLQLKVGAMEQRIQELEQIQLSSCIEIANIPSTLKKENTQNIILNIAKKLDKNPQDVKIIRNVSIHETRGGYIQLEMKEEDTKEGWIAAAREKKPSASDLSTVVTGEYGRNKIYIREALTYYNKTLLWTAKQELQATHQFVWYKKGKILARNNISNKVSNIRSMEDIKKLTNSSS